MQVEFLSKFSKDIDQITVKSVKLSLAKLIQKMEAEDNLDNIPQLKNYQDKNLPIGFVWVTTE